MKLTEIETELKKFFVERDDEIHGLSLSILADTNILLLGPPGIAKTMMVSAWCSHITDYKFFGALLTKVSTPEELAGPFSIKQLNDDKYVRKTNGMLPEAHIGFLDEVFNGNSTILNFLLTLLNERVFYNDGKALKTPLLTVVGASNQIPEPEDGLEALYDRFVLKFVVSPIIEDSNFIKMLLSEKEYHPETFITLQEIQEQKRNINDIKCESSIIKLILDLRKSLQHEGVLTTDRTFKKAVSIIKAEALLNGRDHVVEDDLDILKFVLWSNPEDIQKVYTILLKIINPDKNKVLDIYNRCSIEYERFINEADERKKTDLGSELLASLKKSKTQVHDYYELTKINKASAAEDLLSYEKKIHDYLTQVYKELGINF